MSKNTFHHSKGMIHLPALMAGLVFVVGSLVIGLTVTRVVNLDRSQDTRSQAMVDDDGGGSSTICDSYGNCTTPVPTIAPTLAPTTYTCNGSCMGISVCSMANMVNGTGTCASGTICCKAASTSTPTPQPTASPVTAKCYWGVSSCGLLNPKRQSATGCSSCPSGQAVCCGAEVDNRCTQGNSYCGSDGKLRTCKTDYSGYEIKDCAVGYTCTSGQSACQKIATPTPTPVPVSSCETTCQGETGSFYTNCMATCQKTATLAPINASCSTNADCQSNNCQTTPYGKYCMAYGQSTAVAAGGTCGTTIYNHQCVTGYSCQSNICKLPPTPTPTFLDTVSSLLNNVNLDIYSKISQCDSKPTKAEQDACYQQTQYQAMAALSNTGNSPGSITAYDFEGQNQCKTDPNSQACQNYQRYATTRAAIGTAPAAIYGSAATLPFAAAYGTAAMNSIPAWAFKGLAALNLIDDSITSAQCLAGNLDACGQITTAIMSPIPGTGLADDVMDAMTTFKPLSANRVVADTIYDPLGQAAINQLDLVRQNYSTSVFVPRSEQELINYLSKNNLPATSFSGLDMKSVNGFFEPQSNKIVLNPSGINSHTVFHEAIHAERINSGVNRNLWFNYAGQVPVSRNAQVAIYGALEEFGTISRQLELIDSTSNVTPFLRDALSDYLQANADVYLRSLVDFNNPGTITPEIAQYLNEISQTDPALFIKLTMP
jgi:hypothetical protein